MAQDPKNERLMETTESISPARVPDLPTVPNIQRLLEFCKNIAKSRMFPGIKDEYQALAVVEYGRELGIKPIMALQTIHWIPKKDRPTEGTMAIQSKVLLALAQQRGIDVTVDKKTTKECQLTFSKDKKSFTERFVWQDVERAGLDSRRNYLTYPEEMLFWRCVAKGLRVFDPGLALGIYTVEEIEAGVEQVTLEVEPKKKKEEEKPEEEGAIDAEIVEEEEKTEEPKPEKKKPGPKPKKKEPEPEPTEDKEEKGEEEGTITEEPQKETKEPEVNPEEMTEGEKAEYFSNLFKEDFYVRFGPDKKKVADQYRAFKDFLMDWQRTRKQPREFVRFNQFNHVSMSLGKGSDVELLWINRGYVMKEWIEWEKEQAKIAEEISETDVDDLS